MIEFIHLFYILRLSAVLFNIVAGFLIALTLLRCRKELLYRLFAFTFLMNIIGTVCLLRYDYYYDTPYDAVTTGLLRCAWGIELGAHLVLIIDRIICITSVNLYKKIQESETKIKRIIVCCFFIPSLFILPLNAKRLLHSDRYFEKNFTILKYLASTYYSFARPMLPISLVVLLVQMFRAKTMIAKEKAWLKRFICVYVILAINDQRFEIFSFIGSMCQTAEITCDGILRLFRNYISELFDSIYIWCCVALIPEIRAAFMSAIHCRPSMEEYKETEKSVLVSV